MNYNIIKFIKLLHLDTYNVDYSKTDIFIPFSNVEPIYVHLFLKHEERKCPHCNSHHIIIHDRIKKQIHHLVELEYKCEILFYQTKFKCKDCGKNYLQPNPISNAGKNISLYSEVFILDKLRNPRTTFKDISIRYKISLTSVVRCFDEHVDIPRHKLSEIILLDEFYSKRLTKTKYSFVIFDPLKKTIIDVLDARLKNVLLEYFSKIPLKERLNVKYVGIDMWTTYADVSITVFPNAIVCVDSFHVIQHLIKAINDIRIRIQKLFINQKKIDRNGYYWILKTFHYYLTTNMDNIKYIRKPNSKYSYLWDKYEVLEKVLSTSDVLRRAYELKEAYREFNLTATYDEAIELLPDFISRFRNSECVEFRKFGKMLNDWQHEILNSFITTSGRRVSNGPIESMNGRIKNIIHNGYGFTNFKRFRNRVMFSLNKDEAFNIK